MEEEIGLINGENSKYLKEHFSSFDNSVNILYFNSESTNIDFCLSAKTILYEINELSPNINLQLFNFEKDKDVVQNYNIMAPPAIVIQSDTDIGLRYYGIPSGYEFSTLINSITMVGRGNIEISKVLRERSSLLKEKVEILVFVTPSCPHCPRAATIAYKLACINENIIGTVVEANEFPELSKEFNVISVPKTVINKKHSFEGTFKEDRFFEELIKGIA